MFGYNNKIDVTIKQICIILLIVRCIMKAKDVLLLKGPEVFTISRKKTISEALKTLINNNIGVLPVINEDAKLVGMLSERDIIRKVNSSPNDFLDIPVEQIMTKRIIYADVEDDIEYIESVMTKNKFRHLPIMKNNILVGLISIGDIVKSSLNDKSYENKYLLDYISGNVK